MSRALPRNDTVEQLAIRIPGKTLLTTPETFCRLDFSPHRDLVMKKLLKHADAALTDSRFPINLLACLALVSSPYAVSLPVLMAIAGATIYRQWRTEPESLKLEKWWQHPSWQGLGTYGGICLFFFLIYSATNANLFSFTPRRYSTYFAPVLVWQCCRFSFFFQSLV